MSAEEPELAKANARRAWHQDGMALGSLRELVGAHPDSLRALYGAGRPTDPADLGEAPTGRLLGFGAGSQFFLAVRPLVRALAGDLLPWEGKAFDHGGNGGSNVVLGRHVGRFRAEAGQSVLDGRPTLVLRYDEPAFHNAWPLRTVFDELRTVSPGVALGPAFVPMAGAPRLLLWFGLERRKLS